MNPCRTILILSILLALGVSSADAGGKELGVDNPISRFLEDCVVRPGAEYRALIIYPIVVDGFEKPYPSRTFEEALENDEIVVEEKKSGRLKSELRTLGFGLEPVLILNGQVLVGARRDRFVTHAKIVPSKSKTTLSVEEAEAPSAKREDAFGFEASDTFVPPYVRRFALRGAASAGFRRFLEHYEPVIAEKDERRSVAAVFAGDRIRIKMDDYRRVFRTLPTETAGKMVGFVAFVGDRPVGWEVFGSASLLRAHWDRLLTSYAFAAAGHELRAGVPGAAGRAGALAGPERHDRHIRALRKAIAGAEYRAEREDGDITRVTVQKLGLVGEALVSPSDTLVHFVVFPFTVDDDRIYDGRVAPELDEESELEWLRRKRRTGRPMTEWEKRKLERYERNRAPKPPKPFGSDPSPDDGGGTGGPTPKPKPLPPPVDDKPPSGGGGTGGGVGRGG